MLCVGIGVVDDGFTKISPVRGTVAPAIRSSSSHPKTSAPSPSGPSGSRSSRRNVRAPLRSSRTDRAAWTICQGRSLRLPVLPARLVAADLHGMPGPALPAPCRPVPPGDQDVCNKMCQGPFQARQPWVQWRCSKGMTVFDTLYCGPIESNPSL